MSIEAMKRALELAREGVEIHNENSPEYKVCAALLAIAEAEKQEQDEFVASKTPLTDALNFFTDAERLEIWKKHNVSDSQIAIITKEVLSKFYTTPQQRKPLTDEQIKRLIVEFGKEFNDFDSLPEVCLLVEYDPDIGRIPPRWEPKWHVFQAVRYVLHAAHGIKGEA